MITLFDLPAFFISIQASLVSTEYAFDHNKTPLFLFTRIQQVFSCIYLGAVPTLEFFSFSDIYVISIGPNLI